jgi:hypothetical protein
MELLLRALKFKSTFLPGATAAVSLVLVASALSGCNSSKMFGDLSPSETLTQGYVIDQQAVDSVPVGLQPRTSASRARHAVDDGDLRQ